MHETTPTATGKGEPIVGAARTSGRASNRPQQAVPRLTQVTAQLRQWRPRVAPAVDRRVSTGNAATSAAGSAMNAELITALFGPYRTPGTVKPWTSPNPDSTPSADPRMTTSAS